MRPRHQAEQRPFPPVRTAAALHSAAHNDYEAGQDLHMAVTDSTGCVHEFSRAGLQSGDGSSFNACLVINLLDDPDDPVWQQYWNTALAATAAAHCWSGDSYDETERNCYFFVIEFLKRLRPPALRHTPLTKLAFCSSFVAPRAVAAARYIALYRAVVTRGCVALSAPPAGPPHPHDAGSERRERAEKPLQVLSSRHGLVTRDCDARNRSNNLKESHMDPDSGSKSSARAELPGMASEPPGMASEPQAQIENQVSKVIEDLLEIQRIEQSRRYLTYCIDDVKEELRSFVPQHARNEELSASRVHQFITPEPISLGESSLTSVSNFSGGDEAEHLSSDAISSGGQRRALFSRCRSRPVGDGSPAARGDGSPAARGDGSPAARGDGSPAARGDGSPAARGDGSPAARGDGSPAARVDGSPTARGDGSPAPRRVTRGGVCGAPVTLPPPQSDAGPGPEAQQMPSQVQWAVKNLCVEIQDNGSQRDSRDLKQLQQNWGDVVKWGSSTHHNTRSTQMAGGRVTSLGVNNTVTYNDWVTVDGLPTEPTAGEFVTSSVPSVLSVRPGGVAGLPSEPLASGPWARMPELGARQVSSWDGNYEVGQSARAPAEKRQPRLAEPGARGAAVGGGPLPSSACRQIVELCSKFKEPSCNLFVEGKLLPRARPLRREQTWRYGQEPCPQNYEGKLMGKLDISAGFNWESKGRPSTLSMPGYIYEDGVLPETRC